MSSNLIRSPLRAIQCVLVCRERNGAGWLTLSGPHGWVHGTLDEARAEAEWLAENRGGLPVRELVGGAP